MPPPTDTLNRIRARVAEGRVRVSDHGYDELANDDIYLSDVLDGLAEAVVVEDYPTASKGPSVLVLQYDGEGRPLHVVWGIAKSQDGPAVLVTAYRPDPTRWTSDFSKREQ